MSDVTEITGGGDVQLEIIEVGGGTIEVVGEDKTTIEIIESISTANDLDISTQTRIIEVETKPSENVSINISEDSPINIAVESPPVSVDIFDKVLVSNTTELSFNNLTDKPFAFDTVEQRVTVDNISSSTVITNIINSSTGSFSHIAGNSPITIQDEAVFKSSITSSDNISSSGDLFVPRLNVHGPTGSSGQIYVNDPDDEIGGASGLFINKSGDSAFIYNRDTGSLELGTNDLRQVHIMNTAIEAGLLKIENKGINITGSVTASGNISASGLLFASASGNSGSFQERSNRNNVVLYDITTGGFFFTGSYGGADEASVGFVTQSISESLLFDGNRIILREEATVLNVAGVPTLNVGTSGSIFDFLEAYFFPNDPPVIDNGNSSGIPQIDEFLASGSEVYTLIATDKQVTQGIQTLLFKTSSRYTEDKFKISTNGVITLNTLATSSLNTSENNFYNDQGDGKAHKFSVRVEDNVGGFVEEDLFFRIRPNNAPQFRVNNTSGEVVTSTQVINLFETSSFSGSIAGTGQPSIPIIHFTDPEEDNITIRTGSLPDNFTSSFELIINENNVELSQSISHLNITESSNFTFHLTASDEHFEAGVDDNSTSSLSFTINVIDNDDPIINSNRLPSINESSSAGDIIANLETYPSPIPVLFDPDQNENLTITNFTLIGAFQETQQFLGTNLTESFGGSSLFDPTVNPFEVVNNNVQRKEGIFLNFDLINVYKYSLTAQSLTTGLTGSTGEIEIPISAHQPNILLPGGGNGDQGHIIESAVAGDFISADDDGRITSTPRTIIPADPSTTNILQNWIVTSSEGDFFEAYTFGQFGVERLGEHTDGTGSQIQIRLKNNISGSQFTSGSIITCSITASQDNFPSTKQFFEFPVNITENQSPTLNVIPRTNNWFNTIAIKDAELVSITATDPELDNLDDSSFQLIGDSSTYLSTSFASSQNNGRNSYSIRANDTLRNSPTYPTFSFTASLSDVHNFRSSIVSGAILIDPPLVQGSVEFNNTDITNNIFNVIESAVDTENVVTNFDGVRTGNPAVLTVNFEGSTGGENNSVTAITIDNDILAINNVNNDGFLIKGPTDIPANLTPETVESTRSLITASITITDAFQNEITTSVSVSVAPNFPPTFGLQVIPNLTSSVPAFDQQIARVTNISDVEGDGALIRAFRTDTNEALITSVTLTSVEGISPFKFITLPTAITASKVPINLEVAVTASHINPTSRPNFGRETNSSIIIPIHENTIPTLTVNNITTPVIAGNAPVNTVLATVFTGSTDGDPIDVTIDHPQLQISPNSNFFEIQLDEEILGTLNTDTTISSSVTASDGLFTINEPFNFIVSGNRPPSYAISTTPDLVFPLNQGDQIALISDMTDDLNDSVTMSFASDISDFIIPGGITAVDKRPSLNAIVLEANQFINEFSTTTYKFSVTSSDSFGNESKSIAEFSVIPSEGPSFTSSSLLGPSPSFFRAGEYPISKSILSLSEINNPNAAILDTAYSLNEGETNFFIDNVEGEGFRIKSKIELPGNLDDLEALIPSLVIQGNLTSFVVFDSGITASLLSNNNVVNQVSSSFTVSVAKNNEPTFTVNPLNPPIPIVSGTNVALINDVDDTQTTSTAVEGGYTQTFGPDTPFTASLALPTEIEGVVNEISFYTTITASAEAGIGEGTNLVTLFNDEMDIIIDESIPDFGASSHTVNYTYTWSDKSYQIQSFNDDDSLTYSNAAPSDNDFVDMSSGNNNGTFLNTNKAGVWVRNNGHNKNQNSNLAGFNPSSGTGPRTGGLSNLDIEDNVITQTDGEAYLYAEASSDGGGFPNKQFVLRLPKINLNETNFNEKLILYYYAYGKDIGTFKIWKSTNGTGLDVSTDTLLSFNYYNSSGLNTNVNNITGAQNGVSTSTPDNSDFYRIECDISGFTNEIDGFYIYFEYVSGDSFRGDFAIDNIFIKGDDTQVGNGSFRSEFITASHFLASDMPTHPGRYTHSPLEAFNGEDFLVGGNYWLAINQADPVLGGYIFVDFDFGSYLGRNPKITKIDIIQDSIVYCNRYQISGSNDSTTWTPLYVETEDYSTADRNRTITFNNPNEYKFYRIAADKGFGPPSIPGGPGLASTIFYETPDVIPYAITPVSDSDSDFKIQYVGDDPIENVQTVAFNVNIADKFNNTGSEEISITYDANSAPTYTTSMLPVFGSEPNIVVNSPISQSQLIATVEDVFDLQNDVPFTCSILNSDGLTTNTHFVASTESFADTSRFFITCSSPRESRVNTNVSFIVKVEDNFGSFSSSLLSFTLLGDNIAPSIDDDQSFTIDEHSQPGTFVGNITATVGNPDDVLTFATYSGTYGENRPEIFKVADNGDITVNVHLSASYNDGFGNTLLFAPGFDDSSHIIAVKVSDQNGPTGISDTAFIPITIIPNEAPVFALATRSFGDFEEFIDAGSSIGTVVATDTQGISNTPITYRTSSLYTSNTAVSCDINGNLTFRTRSFEGMHNTLNEESHSVIIEALDNHGNVASQSIHFSILPNIAPVFRLGSTAGEIIENSFTASAISEDETAFTQSFYYSDSNPGDTITINSTSPEPFNSYWDIHNISAENKIEIRQKAGQDLEFDTHANSFHFALSASDNHFIAGNDPNSQTIIEINLPLFSGVTPQFDNTILGVTESAAYTTVAGTIGCSNFPVDFSIVAFEVSAKRLDGGSFVSCTSGELGSSLTDTPSDDPFEISGNNIQVKNGAYFNSDQFNLYRYSASIKSPGGNINSQFINIPIKDQHPGTFNENGPFKMDEAAQTGDKVSRNGGAASGIGSPYSSVQFTLPAGFENSEYSFEISSSEDFFNTTPTNGIEFEYQLIKNLSGSGFLETDTIATIFTASLVGFPTSKLSGSITINIEPNEAPPILSHLDNSNNHNDIDANDTNDLVTMIIGNDPEGDSFTGPNNVTLEPTTYLTASFVPSNTLFIRAKDGTTLSVANSPYEYTASIQDIHGFRSSSVSGSIEITFGDTGSLETPANMFVLNSAGDNDFVVTDEDHMNEEEYKAILNVSYSLESNVTSNTFTATSKPDNYFNISNEGVLTVNGSNFISINNGYDSITQEAHFVSNTGTPGTGSFTVIIRPNLAPEITFTPVTPNLQFEIEAGAVLGTITVTDPENLGIGDVTINGFSGGVISLISGEGSGEFLVVATSNLEDEISETTITFNILATDTFNNQSILSNQSITIDAAIANPGELVLNDGSTDFNFFILETANSEVITTINSNNTLPNSIDLGFPGGIPTFWRSKEDLIDGITDGGASKSTFMTLFYNTSISFGLDFDFGVEKLIGAYKIFTDQTYYPKDFTFEGSNDGTNFNILDSIVNFNFNPGAPGNEDSDAVEESSFLRSLTRNDSLWSGGSNSIPYRYYRFSFTGFTQTDYVIFSEFEFFEKTITAGDGDSVVTSSLGIPNIADRVILSASFGNTSETNPIPNFSIDSAFFQISTSLEGLGFLQVSNTFNAVYNDAAPTTLTPSITYVTQNGTQGPTTPISITVTENFGPIANQLTATTGTYMTASNPNAADGQGSFLTTSNVVFTVGGISDGEGDFPYTASITNGNVTAGAVTLDGSNTGSFQIFPTSTITDNTEGDIYSFNFRLIDSKGKFRDFTNNQFTIATPVLEEPFAATKIYIYTSQANTDTGLSTNYNNAMGIQVPNTPPSTSTLLTDVIVGGINYTNYINSKVFHNVAAGNILGQNTFIMGSSIITRRATINVTEPVNLSTVFQELGVVNMTQVGTSEQILIFIPATDDITGKPTIMTDVENQAGKHILGVSTDPGSTTFDGTTDNFDYNALGAIQASQVNVITLNNAHEGYTNWYVIGQKGKSSLNSAEFRIRES